jgi:peptidoglycan/LPS O-acetylase OafA/YrhL
MLLRFWIRRWFRTLPNYYLVLIVLVAATFFARDPLVPLPQQIGRYFTFTQNLAWPHPEFFGEAWSLAVEEWFYLCITIPLYLATKLRNVDRRRIMLVCVALVIAFSSAYRIYCIDATAEITMDEWKHFHRMQVITRMDSLMFGVLGAYLSLYHRSLWERIARYTFIPGLVILAFDRAMYLGEPNMFYISHISLSLAPFATLLLLPKLSGWHAKPGYFVSAVTFISVISYSLYLINQALVSETVIPLIMPELMHYLWRFSEHTPIIRWALYWTLSIVGSFLLYKYFETPMINLRDRWSRDGHVPAQAFQGQGPTSR